MQRRIRRALAPTGAAGFPFVRRLERRALPFPVPCSYSANCERLVTAASDGCVRNASMQRATVTAARDWRHTEMTLAPLLPLGNHSTRNAFDSVPKQACGAAAAGRRPRGCICSRSRALTVGGRTTGAVQRPQSAQNRPTNQPTAAITQRTKCGSCGNRTQRTPA